MKYVLILVMLILNSAAMALSPQQYCEKLEARSRNSFEMLNMEVGNLSVVQQALGGVLTRHGSPGPYGGLIICTPAVTTTPILNAMNATKTTVVKYCRRGVFVIMQLIESISNSTVDVSGLSVSCSIPYAGDEGGNGTVNYPTQRITSIGKKQISCSSGTNEVRTVNPTPGAVDATYPAAYEGTIFTIPTQSDLISYCNIP